MAIHPLFGHFGECIPQGFACCPFPSHDFYAVLGGVGGLQIRYRYIKFLEASGGAKTTTVSWKPDSSGAPGAPWYGKTNNKPSPIITVKVNFGSRFTSRQPFLSFLFYVRTGACTGKRWSSIGISWWCQRWTTHFTMVPTSGMNPWVVWGWCMIESCCI